MIEDEGDLVMVVSVPILAAVALLAIFGLETLAAVVSVIGFVVVVPLLLQFGDRLLADDDESSKTDPVEKLRQQYVAGELSEAEFERRVERLLETGDAETDGAAMERAAERQSEPGRGT